MAKPTAGSVAQLPTAPADNPKTGLLAQDARATAEGYRAALANQQELGDNQVKTGLNVDK